MDVFENNTFAMGGKPDFENAFTRLDVNTFVVCKCRFDSVDAANFDVAGCNTNEAALQKDFAGVRIEGQVIVLCFAVFLFKDDHGYNSID
ncbi:hypothetical protein TPHV1_190002 [Treponema phagedenis]|uniref:Uncharacterized protein n=1 Tax=Treponema phagedenis TaxID=162 RepID=A0A0B7GWP2_TREPH|nr:hypothetical protein TPHV1_190002 [Treponema phagedenis]